MIAMGMGIADLIVFAAALVAGMKVVLTVHKVSYISFI